MGRKVSSDNATVVAATLEVVEQILNEMGLADFSSESILVEPDSLDGDVVLRSKADFGRFIGGFSIRLGCLPYALQAVERLTVREFCERYARESYPETPGTPLERDRYTLAGPPRAERAVFTPQTFPICFVLGCGRSGTTLFRAMLNVHEALWAPGELHLAQYDTMAERATRANPILRRTFVPEAGSRFGETPDSFYQRLESWERESLPTPEVYRRLHEANPQALIVDKCPPYSAWPEDLAWIAHHFPRARFIHIIRSPHDVIRSMVRMQFYKGALQMFEPGINPYHVAEILWFRHNSNIAELTSRLAKERTLLVRYEDLVANPQTTLSEVCNLLGVDYELRMENPYEHNAGPVALGAGDPQVNRMTEVEKREPSKPLYAVGAQCEELARGYGY